jgi:hypothetical protein
MRCSLLLLSAYLDHELNDRRAGELEAHLIACTRCQAGLGYLREEAQRIAGLAHVRVPDRSAHALLTHVGLIAPEDDLPGNLPVAPPEPSETDAPPWLGGRPGKALPWSPPERTVTGTPLPAAGAPYTAAGSPVATLEPPSVPVLRPPGPQAQAGHDTAQLEVPGVAIPPPDRLVQPLSPPEAVAEPEPPSEPASWDLEDLEDVPAAPRRAPARKLPPALRRVIDSVALRWTLTFGGLRQMEERTEPRPVPRASLPPIEVDDWDLPEHFEAPLPPEPPQAPPPAGAPIAVEPPPTAPPAAPGRHLRGVSGRRGAGPAPWLERVRAASLPATLPAGARGRQQALWAFGAVTALLLVTGLLVGKQAVTAPGAALPPPAPSLRPTPAPVVSPPAASASQQPAPTPSTGPSPLHLTGARTLGSGAAGYAVTSVRYGVHPGDFRLVFDLQSPSEAGSPAVTAGWGNATTLYVIFAGVDPSSPPSPPRGIVTAVTVLPAATMPGRTVYAITLSRAATFSVLYLNGPTRLVVDVR